MASKNFEDCNLDDSDFFKAYSKGTKSRKNVYKRTKNPKKGNSSKEIVKAEDQWKVGDHCRAVYSADQCIYEAKICSIECGYCTVEFLGYGDKETVDFTDLLESAGKKARKQQSKTALAGFSTTSDSCLTNDGDTASYSCPSASHSRTAASHPRTAASHPRTAASHPRTAASHPRTAASHPRTAASHPRTAASHPRTAASHPHATANHLNAATACYAPPAVPSSMPFLPAPPMPQCPSVAPNPDLSAMLVSWYMAGYYTGLHQGQKSSQFSQHCCSHVNKYYH